MNPPTNGPWHASKKSHGSEVTAANGLGVAWCGIASMVSIDHGSYHIDADEAFANAQLIALAQDLLAALVGAANYIDALGGNSQAYRILIAKATA